MKRMKFGDGDDVENVDPSVCLSNISMSTLGLLELVCIRAFATAKKSKMEHIRERHAAAELSSVLGICGNRWLRGFGIVLEVDQALG